MRPEELGLYPGRDSDRALLDAVRPSSWQNPPPRPRYHLVVVGGGTGGLVTAAAAAALGATVALVERRLLGGDCLNVGCVPSKAVIRAARGWHEASLAASRFGAPTRTGGNADVRTAMDRMRHIRASIAPHDGAARFASLGVDVFLGNARFTSPHDVEVDGARLRFRRAVIATGSRPAIPGVPGLAESDPFTSDTIFALDHAPPRLAVIGGGPIGCELAQAFARFGSRVTIIEAEEHILPREDGAAASIVEEALRREGVSVLSPARVRNVTREGDVRTLHIDGKGGPASVVAEAILVAAGRAPELDGLGLEDAGVRAGRAGVIVDDRLRTTNPRVYAVGDVTGAAGATHIADAHARLVVANALFFGRGRASRLIAPRCTFTDPELAHVGLTPGDAAARGVRLDTIEVPLHSVDRARIDGADDGLLRVHLAPGRDRILGATLVAPHAGDMIGEVALAMTARVGLSVIGRTIHQYPTMAEAFRKAADAWRRRKLTSRAQRLLRSYFRIIR